MRANTAHFDSERGVARLGHGDDGVVEIGEGCKDAPKQRLGEEERKLQKSREEHKSESTYHNMFAIEPRTVLDRKLEVVSEHAEPLLKRRLEVRAQK